jgi:hypothetical protein
MDYENLFSTHLPLAVDRPAGLAASTKYVFSVTYTHPDVLPAEGLIDAVAAALRREPGRKSLSRGKRRTAFAHRAVFPAKLAGPLPCAALAGDGGHTVH